MAQTPRHFSFFRNWSATIEGMHTTTPLPIVTAEQMAAVDRAIVDVCGLQLVQVMEVAGRAVALVARTVHPTGPVAVLCGSGGNGGDGFVAARYLAGWGFEVACWLVKPVPTYSGLAAHQLQVCQKLGIPIVEPDQQIDLTAATLIIDGLFGFGLSAPPSGRAAALIEAANRCPAPVLAIDIPSGIDATTGMPLEPAIHADFTLTLGLPKQGLLTSFGPSRAGQVIVADIGIPAAAYTAVGISLTALFDDAEFVTLDGRRWPT